MGAHIAHAVLPAAVGEISYHAPFQTAGVYQNGAGLHVGQRILYHLDGNALVQAENHHVIGAVLHAAGAVNGAVLQSLFQDFRLYIAAVYGVSGGCFYRFADGTADESHADN